MRFFYVDPGLRDNAGHHASHCRAVVGELRRRGIPTMVAGYKVLDDALKAELGAVPLLRAYLYFVTDRDPLAGWLNAFEVVSETTREDLARLGDLGPEDIVYMASAYPGQLMGIGRWLGDLAPERVPFVLVDLLGHPGVNGKRTETGYAFSVRHGDPRAMLYRHAASRIAKNKLRRLVLCHSDTRAAEAFSDVLGVEVTALWLPFEAVTTRRNRAGAQPVTVGLLGCQRNQEKGYHHMPGVLGDLLRSRRSVRLLIHNSCPGHYPAMAEPLRALAATDPRVRLEERAVDLAGWAELLEATDLMLCPYKPDAYQFMSSGIHAEAIANAIPSVVPADTALARALEVFGRGGTTFDAFEPKAILQATEEALDRFDDYAERAWAGSGIWHETRGPGRLVDAVLALARER